MYSSTPFDATPGFLGQAPASTRGFLAGFRAWRERRRRIDQITAELAAHSDRELADLGMSRCDIPDVARGTFRRAV